ncbi:MAG: hypothetical protein JXA14_17430 [Anaerolineae bacterium]|nr:hypothetical protein [Anaerolineae bacterium]
MRTRRWFARWGGPALVLAIILVGTFLATLVLRELRPCGWLDVALRGDDCLCMEIDLAGSPLEASECIP